MRTRRDKQEDLWPDFESIFEGIRMILVDGLLLIAFGALLYSAIREVLPH